jgi:hypothetical protein
LASKYKRVRAVKIWKIQNVDGANSASVEGPNTRMYAPAAGEGKGPEIISRS